MDKRKRAGSQRKQGFSGQSAARLAQKLNNQTTKGMLPQGSIPFRIRQRRSFGAMFFHPPTDSRFFLFSASLKPHTGPSTPMPAKPFLRICSALPVCCSGIEAALAAPRSLLCPSSRSFRGQEAPRRVHRGNGATGREGTARRIFPTKG